MKKIFATLLVIALLLSSALAEGAVPAASGGTFTLTVRGETVALNYDSDPEYSNIVNGSIQASFYSETEKGTMYELYMLFPDTVKSGDVVTTQSSIAAGQNDPGVMIFITDDAQEIYAAAFQFSSGAYPTGSSYEIRFDSVAPAGNTCAYKGSVTSTLVVMDKLYNPQYPLEITGTFDFTFDMNSTYAPQKPAPSEAAPGSETTPAPEAMPAPSAPVQPEATPAPDHPMPTPFVPVFPAAPKNTPSLITPADAKKI